MNAIFEKVKLCNHAIPCMFYPLAKNMSFSLSELLSDSEKQKQLLVETSKSYPVGAVIRMTELWCEAAAFGMEYHITENSFPQLGIPLYNESNELKEAVFPQVYNKITTPLIEAVRLAVPLMDKPLIVGATGPYTLGAVLNGSENFMINCMTEPDIVHAFLEKLTVFLIEYISAYKSAGASAILLAEPSTAMISPEMMDEFSNSYIQKIIRALQDSRFSIIYHNCGAVNMHMESISKLDADAFHFGNEVDLDKALGCIGKEKLVMGNIDPRLFIADNKVAIEKTTMDLLNKYSSFENWKISTGCDLSPDSSVQDIEMFLQTVEKYYSQHIRVPSFSTGNPEKDSNPAADMRADIFRRL
jgi:uroporphyrinogen decarboxylase